MCSPETGGGHLSTSDAVRWQSRRCYHSGWHREGRQRLECLILASSAVTSKREAQAASEPCVLPIGRKSFIVGHQRRPFESLGGVVDSRSCGDSSLGIRSAVRSPEETHGRFPRSPDRQNTRSWKRPGLKMEWFGWLNRSTFEVAFVPRRYLAMWRA